MPYVLTLPDGQQIRVNDDTDPKQALGELQGIYPDSFKGGNPPESYSLITDIGKTIDVPIGVGLKDAIYGTKEDLPDAWSKPAEFDTIDAIQRGAWQMLSGVTDTIPGAVGGWLGFDDYKAQQEQEAKQFMEWVGQNNPARYTGTLSESINDPRYGGNRFTRGLGWVAERGFESSPSMALSVGTGGLGALSAPALGLSRLGGATLGGFAGSMATEGADQYKQLQERLGRDPTFLETATTASVASALDVIVPIRLLAKARMAGIAPEEIAKGIKNSWLRDVGYEAATEGGQAATNIAAAKFIDENYDAINWKNAEDVISNALVGGLVGGVASAVTPARDDGSAETPPLPGLEDQTAQPGGNISPYGGVVGQYIPQERRKVLGVYQKSLSAVGDTEGVNTLQRVFDTSDDSQLGDLPDLARDAIPKLDSTIRQLDTKISAGDYTAEEKSALNRALKVRREWDSLLAKRAEEDQKARIYANEQAYPESVLKIFTQHSKNFPGTTNLGEVANKITPDNAVQAIKLGNAIITESSRMKGGEAGAIRALGEEIRNKGVVANPISKAREYAKSQSKLQQGEVNQTAAYNEALLTTLDAKIDHYKKQGLLPQDFSGDIVQKYSAVEAIEEKAKPVVESKPVEVTQPVQKPELVETTQPVEEPTVRGKPDDERVPFNPAMVNREAFDNVITQDRFTALAGDLAKGNAYKRIFNSVFGVGKDAKTAVQAGSAISALRKIVESSKSNTERELASRLLGVADKTERPSYVSTPNITPEQRTLHETDSAISQSMDAWRDFIDTRDTPNVNPEQIAMALSQAENAEMVAEEALLKAVEAGVVKRGDKPVTAKDVQKLIAKKQGERQDYSNLSLEDKASYWKNMRLNLGDVYQQVGSRGEEVATANEIESLVNLATTTKNPTEYTNALAQLMSYARDYANIAIAGNANQSTEATLTKLIDTLSSFPRDDMEKAMSKLGEQDIKLEKRTKKAIQEELAKEEEAKEKSSPTSMPIKIGESLEQAIVDINSGLGGDIADSDLVKSYLKEQKRLEKRGLTSADMLGRLAKVNTERKRLGLPVLNEELITKTFDAVEGGAQLTMDHPGIIELNKAVNEILKAEISATSVDMAFEGFDSKNEKVVGKYSKDMHTRMKALWDNKFDGDRSERANASDVLDILGQSGQFGRLVGTLKSALGKSAKDIEVVITTEPNEKPHYDSGDKTLYIPKRFMGYPRVVTHELIHAATVHVVEAYKAGTLTDAKTIEAMDALTHIYETVKKVAKKDRVGAYGLTSIEEFLSELYTNPQFQWYLSQMPATMLRVPNSFMGKVKNLLQATWDTIKTALNIPMDKINVFHTATAISDNLMKLAEGKTFVSDGKIYYGDFADNMTGKDILAEHMANMDAARRLQKATGKDSLLGKMLDFMNPVGKGHGSRPGRLYMMTIPQIIHEWGKLFDTKMSNYIPADKELDLYFKIKEKFPTNISVELYTKEYKKAFGGAERDAVQKAYGTLQYVSKTYPAERKHIVQSYTNPANNYYDGIQRLGGDRNRLFDSGQKVVEGLYKFVTKNKAGAKLERIATLASRYMIDPTLKPSEYKPNEKNPHLTAKQQEEIYLELHKMYQELPAEGKQLLVDYKKYVRDTYAELLKVLESSVEDFGSKQRMTDLIRSMMEMRMENPLYVHLSREGDNWVYATMKINGQEEFYAMAFGTPNEAHRAVENIKKMYPGSHVESFQTTKEVGLRSKIPPRGFMKDVMVLLKEAGVKQDIQDQIYETFLKTLPEASISKFFIKRQGLGIEGFKEDFPHAAAIYVDRISRQIPRLKYGRLMDAATDDMEMLAMLEQDPDRKIKMNDVVNRFRQNTLAIQNYRSNALVKILGGAGFTFYMGASLASALVNMTQIVVTGIPYLGARYGTGPAAREIQHAFEQLLFNPKAKIKGKEGLRTLLESTTGHERQAMQELYALDKLQSTQVFDTVGLSEMDSDTFSPFKSKWNRIMTYMFHHAERVNREIIALAAYRLEYARQMAENGGDMTRAYKAAVDYAIDAIDMSHGNYSYSAAAMPWKSNTGRILLMFKKYPQHMAYFLMSTLHEMVKGETKAVKQEAMKRFGLLLATSWAMGGLAAMPLVGFLEMLIDSFDDDDDEQKDYFMQWANRKLGDLGYWGLMNYVTGWDIASRTGYNNIVFRDDKAIEAKDMGKYITDQVLGPIYGISNNIFEGYRLLTEGHADRAMESFSPVAVRNVLKGTRYMFDGAATTASTAKIMETDVLDSISQMIGFTPAELRKIYEDNSFLMAQHKHAQTIRKNIMAKYAMSIVRGEPESQQKQYDRIIKFNQAYPKYAISVDALSASIRRKIELIAVASRQRGLELEDDIYHWLNQTLEPIEGQETEDYTLH